MITASQSKQLTDYGYKEQDLESLFNALPSSIWVTPNEINFKRQRVVFNFSKQEVYWVGTLSVPNPETEDIYILHRIKKKDIIDVIVGMILFLEQNKMLGPNV